LPEFRIFRQAGVVCSMDEAVDEAISHIARGAHSRVQEEHAGLAIRRLCIRRWTTEHLTPVPRQPLYVIGMARMREGVVQ
jgi:hypothetical protein